VFQLLNLVHTNIYTKIAEEKKVDSAFMQSDLQEQLGLSALLKGTDIFHLLGSGTQTSNPVVTGTMLLTGNLPAAVNKAFISCVICSIFLSTLLGRALK
jgi:hypothetical protein